MSTGISKSTLHTAPTAGKHLATKDYIDSTGGSLATGIAAHASASDPHSSYLYFRPTSARPDTIDAQDDCINLQITAFAGQAEDIISVIDSASANSFRVDSIGKTYVAGLDLGGLQSTNVPAPTAGDSIANKTYVDNISGSLRNMIPVDSGSWDVAMWHGNAVDSAGSGGTIAYANSSVASNTAYNGHSVIFNMINGRQTALSVQTLIPDWVDTGSNIRMKFLSRISGTPSSTGQLNLRFTVRVVNDNDNITNAGNVFSGNTLKQIGTYANADYAITDMGIVISGGYYSRDSLVEGMLIRDAKGTSLDDNFESIVQAIGVRFSAACRRRNNE